MDIIQGKLIKRKIRSKKDNLGNYCNSLVKGNESFIFDWGWNGKLKVMRN